MGLSFTLTRQMNPSLYDTQEEISEDNRTGTKIMLVSKEAIQRLNKNLLKVNYCRYCSQIASLTN
jgi:hypothetical protein